MCNQQLMKQLIKKVLKKTSVVFRS